MNIIMYTVLKAGIHVLCVGLRFHVHVKCVVGPSLKITVK
jgi:hypothetical protein